MVKKKKTKKKIPPPKTSKAQSRKRTDWLSSREQIEWASHILGGVDVDPCAHESQTWSPKHCFYGRGSEGDADDGMVAPWHQLGQGRVYVYPPWVEMPHHDPSGVPTCEYSLARWVMKMHGEAALGASVFFFGPASTDKVWFHHYVARAAAFCLLQNRANLRLPGVPVGRPAPTAQAHLVALWSSDGGSVDRFCTLFDSLGLVVEPGL